MMFDAGIHGIVEVDTVEHIPSLGGMPCDKGVLWKDGHKITYLNFGRKGCAKTDAYEVPAKDEEERRRNRQRLERAVSQIVGAPVTITKREPAPGMPPF